MATAPLLERVDDAPTSIAVVVAQTPAVVLIDQAKRDDLFAHIQREIDGFTPDLTTPKGRDAIKSFAFKITRTKTAIDAAGKQLNEEARAKINVVDAARRDARDKLDAMAADVRRPLTEWEAAEEARVAECRAVLADLRASATVTLDDTAQTVRERGMRIWEVAIDPERFGDMADEAGAVKEVTVSTLRTALARLTKEEADHAELDELRAQAAERDRAEAERREAEEAERRQQEEARQAEERRAAAERAEAERIAAAERAAEERARAEAERRHAEEIAAERRRAEDAERAVAAERDRLARAEKERTEAAERESAAQRKREADQAHRTRLKSEAKQALMTCGVDEETARKIVVAVIAREIPHVRMEF
jgi:hypothetical protein